MRAAGLLLIITVADPMAIVSGGPVQIAISPTVAAGMPPMMTLGEPLAMGPPTWGTVPVTMGQVCMSPMRAAGFINISLKDERVININTILIIQINWLFNAMCKQK